MKSRDIHGAMNAALGAAMAFVGGYYFSELPDAGIAVLMAGSLFLVGREIWMMGDNQIWKAVPQKKEPTQVHVGLNSNIDAALAFSKIGFENEKWIPKFPVESRSLSPKDRGNIRFLCNKHGVEEVAFLGVVLPVNAL